MAREILETKRKALRINLNNHIYGTFAEIGGGQEVARNFFMAGGASGTIAKTMSAYDMVFSNSIYGEEESGRYVSKSRLQKMLDVEFGLLRERLIGAFYQDKSFFAFANTVATLNFKKTNEPHGWVGIRFQRTHGAEPSDIIFHVRLLDADVTLQQNVLGVLGVNLVYAAYYYRHEIQIMIESLVDNLSKDAIEIDLIHIEGPLSKHIDERLINLYLIAKGFSAAAIFDANGTALQAKDLLYKKDIMILRTKYRQKSAPNFHLFNCAVEEFKKSQQVNKKDLVVLIEVLMINFLEKDKEVNREDLQGFASCAEKLCATGNAVIVSNFTRNHRLAKYLSRCKPNRVGISTNANNLKNIFDASKFGENYTNELLTYISDLFSSNVKLYVYPYLNKESGEIITTQNMPISPEAKPLFDFLIKNEYIRDIEGFNAQDVKAV